jgi:hypothetical protein
MAFVSPWFHCPKRENHQTFFSIDVQTMEILSTKSLHLHMSQIHLITKQFHAQTYHVR